MNVDEVKDWNVWLEGCDGNPEYGENFPAHFFGTYHGTWLEACKKAMPKVSSQGVHALDINRFGPGLHGTWGLQFHDNEADARKANG